MYQATLTAAHPLNLTNDIEAKAAFKFHKMVRDTRYTDFDRHMAGLKPNESILILDFKANITLVKDRSRMPMFSSVHHKGPFLELPPSFAHQEEFDTKCTLR